MSNDQKEYVMSDKCIAEIAARVALSNLGLGHHGITTRKPERWSSSAYSSVLELGGHFIENDEMEDVFISEAEGWEESFKKLDAERIVAVWGPANPWMVELIAMDKAAQAS